MRINLYPGDKIFLFKVIIKDQAQSGCMAAFIYKKGTAGLYAVTCAHVVSVGGDPSNEIVSRDVFAPDLSSPTVPTVAFVDSKDLSETDLALLKVLAPNELKEDNFCLGGISTAVPLQARVALR